MLKNFFLAGLFLLSIFCFSKNNKNKKILKIRNIKLHLSFELVFDSRQNLLYCLLLSNIFFSVTLLSDP